MDYQKMKRLQYFKLLNLAQESLLELTKVELIKHK